jgi:hypothetical protein
MERTLVRSIAPSPSRPIGRAGQFIPITAMVAFTTVVFLVGVVNVYKVAQAKLKVQNLADAVALNIASQMASSMNKVTDMNEWMNHMVSGSTSAPGEVPNCTTTDRSGLPPISCVENDNADRSIFQFTSKASASSYAQLVQTINLAQTQFQNAYNNFIGAGTRSNSSIATQSSLNSVLYNDIPELNNPGTSVFVWNYDSAKPTDQEVQQAAADARLAVAQPSSNTSGQGNLNAQMQALNFQPHPVTVTFQTPMPGLMSGQLPNVTAQSLGRLAAEGKNQPIGDIGWMEPAPNQPTLNIGPTNKPRIGAGAIVIRAINVPILGSVAVKAQAQAFVVWGSGTTGIDPNVDANHPVFKPTYWVKLAGS